MTAKLNNIKIFVLSDTDSDSLIHTRFRCSSKKKKRKKKVSCFSFSENVFCMYALKYALIIFFQNHFYHILSSLASFNIGMLLEEHTTCLIFISLNDGKHFE